MAHSLILMKYIKFDFTDIECNSLRFVTSSLAEDHSA